MKSPLSGKLLLLVLLGFGSLAGLLVVAGMGNAQQDNLQPQPAPVSVADVVLQPSYSYSQRVLARVEALNSSSIGFDVAGVVTQVHIDEGSKVKQGDLIASLDIERLVASKNELLSALKRAQAEEKLAKLSKNRLQDVVDKGLESKQLLDEAIVSLEVAKASVAQIEAQINSLAVEFNKSSLYATFDATVIQRHIDPGVSIAPGQAIVTIQSDNQLELRASLPANLINWLQPGDLVDFADGSGSAVLSRFVNTQNTQTRTQDAFFTVNSEQWQAQTGQIVNLIVPVSKSANGMWVPVSALSGGIRGMWTVYVVAKEQPATISARIVEVVYADDERAFISGALSAGEQIVLDGTQRIVPGQRVSIIKE